MHFTLGDVRVDLVVDMASFPIPATRILPGRNLGELLPHQTLLEPDHVDFARGEILLGMQALLLRLPGLTVLVDTCVGEDKQRPARLEWHRRTAGGFLASLGVPPEAVDVVLCTHLHADHVGWNTRLVDGRWVPAFPRARYLVGRRELEYWQTRVAAEPGVNHGAFADSVQPLLEAGVLDAVADGLELAPGLTLKPLPGHTVGHMGLWLERQGARAIFCGDAIHSPVQILRPDWSSAFCSDPEEAAVTRRTLLECAAEDGVVLVPAHFRHCGCTRIRRDGEDYRPVFGAG